MANVSEWLLLANFKADEKTEPENTREKTKE